jgi:hypothetical protein
MSTTVDCGHRWMPWGVCDDCGMTTAMIVQQGNIRQEKDRAKVHLELKLYSAKARILVRNFLGVSKYSNTPIIIDREKPNSPPKVKGESWGYYTKGGTPITYPSAYSKVGWSNMEYRHSTLEFRVGRDWLLKNLEISEERDDELRLRASR